MVVTFSSRDPYPVTSDSLVVYESFTDYLFSPSGLLDIPFDNIMLFRYALY